MEYKWNKEKCSWIVYCNYLIFINEKEIELNRNYKTKFFKKYSKKIIIYTILNHNYVNNILGKKMNFILICLFKKLFLNH